MLFSLFLFILNRHSFSWCPWLLGWLLFDLLDGFQGHLWRFFILRSSCFSCFNVRQFYIFHSSKCHVNSVLTATLLVESFGAATAAYDLPTTAGVAISINVLASVNDTLFCTLTCWTRMYTTKLVLGSDLTKQWLLTVQLWLYMMYIPKGNILGGRYKPWLHHQDPIIHLTKNAEYELCRYWSFSERMFTLVHTGDKIRKASKTWRSFIIPQYHKLSPN